MPKFVIGAFLLALVAAMFALPALAALQFPPLTGRVVDQAALLSPAARDRLTGWLAAFEHDTGRQVVVATVKSLEGVPIEDYGYQLGRAWGIGQKDKNTGAILLVAPTERKVRIEVGYGLEGELTDAISSTIINQDILPQFRQGKYEAGIVAGTAAVLRALGWKGNGTAVLPPPAPRNGSALSLIPFLLFLVMIGFFIWRARRHGIARGSGMGPFWTGAMLGSMSGSGSSSGFSGGGFTGGGGSFGGGGASGGW